VTDDGRTDYGLTDDGLTDDGLTDEVRRHRKPGHPISPWLLNRWSPRAMSGEPLAESELLPLFEAARWAPSSFNAQLWRFLYARRDTDKWPFFFDLLVESNRQWAQRAAVLVVVVSRMNFERNEKPARTHAFDAGAAWENLALEAAARGLVAHGMQGFDYDRARAVLGVPDDFAVLAMIALGKRGHVEELPEKLRAIEFPNDRRPLHEIAWEGAFPKKA
jgi:nitroreductase